MTITPNMLFELFLSCLIGAAAGFGVFASMRHFRISQLERELEELKANNRQLRQMYEDACAFGGRTKNVVAFTPRGGGPGAA